MSNSSNSSFTFHTKKRRQLTLPAPPHKKPKKNTVQEAVLNIKTLGIPLISNSTTQFCESLRLEPYKPYTIGRRSKSCEFAFSDRRVSRRHCQLYFDPLNKRVYLSDGLFLGYIRCNGSFTDFRAKVSTNGVFVNGVRVSGVVELGVGDLVRLVCGFCSSVGFVVEKTVFVEEVDYRSYSCTALSKQARFRTLESSRVLDNTRLFLSWCRNILCSDDPVSYICKCVVLSPNVIKSVPDLMLDNGFGICSNSGLRTECRNRKRVYTKEFEAVENCECISQNETIFVSEENTEIKTPGLVTPEENTEIKTPDLVSEENTEIKTPDLVTPEENTEIKTQDLVSEENTEIKTPDLVTPEENTEIKTPDLVTPANADTLSGDATDIHEHREVVDDENRGGSIMPPGKKFYLNRLQFEGQHIEESDVVSLPELFHPVESLERVFIATFTSDILWFLNYCKIPFHLPVTIACHSTERCWSSDPNQRASMPFSDFPNLTVVYPPFPEATAFNNDRKNSGIGCHHPKLFVLQREDNMRVVITSANLVEKQWHRISNTVWWQDFPRLSFPNCSSLFSPISVGEINPDSKNCDFAAELAVFMASLVANVPSQAHWILELVKYDFKRAAGYLVTSVPGIHTQRSPYVYESKHHLLGNKHKLEKFSCASFLSSVEASVVGISHIYRVSVDSSGEHLKKLALFLENCHQNMDGMSEVVLRRDTNIAADVNAVSVLIPNPEDFSMGDYVQLGFLPRDVAKWVAPLSDFSLFAFSAFINPIEVLATALEGNSKKVKLVLCVYEGSSFSTISEVTQLEHVSAICTLVASSQRYVGLWRLKEVLSQYKWPEHLESEFLYAASSVGSINAQFLAAFSEAAGKKSMPFPDSEESDPNWGRWSASQELKNPSINIIFPSIECVKKNRNGVMASRFLLCFSQKTWQRLEKVGILHDAIPHKSDRIGFPMHVKVGRRRFVSKKDGSSFGWVYCGSHNISAAAWGLPISERQLRLRVLNYEIGIVFVAPPPESVEQIVESLDEIVVPFVVPPPKYGVGDKPATGRAMWEALKEERETSEAILSGVGEDDLGEDEVSGEEEVEVVENAAHYVAREKDEEVAYADELWSQVDSVES